jgi:serine protease inhibitor
MAQGKYRARFAFGAVLIAALGVAACGGGGDASSPSSNPTSTPSSPSTPPSAPPTSSSTPTAVAQAESEQTAVNPTIVAADNGFGLRLFQTLQPSATGNIAISPLSVAMALQILYNGAAGSTQSAMAQTLELGTLSLADMNTANAALQASLLTADPLLTLVIANSLWTQSSDSTVLPAFTQADQTYYGATLGDLSGAPANVNAWVSNATQGLITNILPAGDYNSAVAVIANALYFKGPWSTAFDTAQTANQSFTLADGTQTSVPMMHQSGNYAYLEGANFQALSLPYGSGRMSMLIILPNAGVSLSSFVASMTLDDLNGWIATLKSAGGSIGLPRFTATYQTQGLAQVLGTLGMSVALCPPTSSDANFSALSSQAVCVTDAVHQTVVQVDEAGTVAAAATTVTVGIEAVEVSTFTMTMDRPFLYAIRDDVTGELLFIGALTNP